MDDKEYKSLKEATSTFIDLYPTNHPMLKSLNKLPLKNNKDKPKSSILNAMDTVRKRTKQRDAEIEFLMDDDACDVQYKYKQKEGKILSPGQKRKQWLMNNIFNPAAKLMSPTTQKYFNETVNMTQKVAQGAYDRGLKNFYDGVSSGNPIKMITNSVVALPSLAIGAGEGIANYTTDDKYQEEVKGVGNLVDIGFKATSLNKIVSEPTKRKSVYEAMETFIGLNADFYDQYKTSKNQKKQKQHVSKNVSIENKAKRFFKSQKIPFSKMPNITHSPDMPSSIEGVYTKGAIHLAKNFRVSDKKAEAVAMHEIYHHLAKDKSIDIEEQNANEIEKLYENQIQEQHMSKQEIYDELYKRVKKLMIEHHTQNKVAC
jgi:hypothetical protein